jgi:DNA-binding response OmpR family regulator
MRDDLSRRDLEVDVCRGLPFAAGRLAEFVFDVVLLDQRVPPGGLELARSVRLADPRVGIVMLGADWDPVERLLALEEICDDCVSGSDDLTEVAARLRAVARRTRSARGPIDLSWGPLRVDLLRGRASAGGSELNLQPLQLRMLAFLVQNAERLISHEQLRAQVFRVAQAKHSTGIARQVCLLRASLGPLRGLIRTVRGGYILGGPPARADLRNGAGRSEGV